CTLFTAPTAFRAIRQQDPEGDHIARHDLSRFRALFLAGERCDPATLEWAEERLGVPVIDHYWQTETGWPVVADCMGIEPLPVVAGSPTRPVPGRDVRVKDEGGQELPLGLIVLKAGVERDHEEICGEAVQLVRDRIGPVAAFKKAVVVARLPKTRSGKILRGTMRRIADGEEYTTPATIDDPAILDEISTALERAGYVRAGSAVTR